MLELVDIGKTLAAVSVARQLYSYDLTQARAFVENLRSQQPDDEKPRG